MEIGLFAIDNNLFTRSRISIATVNSTRLRAIELATLAVCGMLAVAAVTMWMPSWRIPGSAILRAGVPMMCGFALVPRRNSGLVMSLTAFMICAALQFGGLIPMRPASIAGMITLGIAMDASLRSFATWNIPIYVRSMIAGAVANGVAFVIRFGMTFSVSQISEIHTLQGISFAVLASFLLCGMLMGLLCAPLVFRMR